MLTHNVGLLQVTMCRAHDWNRAAANVSWAVISCYLFLEFDTLYPAIPYHSVNTLLAYIIYPLVIAEV